jgi:hypothetical protein
MPGESTNYVWRKAIAGAGTHIIITDPNTNEIIGRGANFTFQDAFDLHAVEEYNNTGIDEYVPGLHRGTGTIGTFTTPKINSELPGRTKAEGFNHLGPYTLQELIATNRPGAEKVLNTFKNVMFSLSGGNFAATGLSGRNVNFVFTERIAGDGQVDPTSEYYEEGAEPYPYF